MAPTIAPTLDSDPNRENCKQARLGKAKHYNLPGLMEQWDSRMIHLGESEAEVSNDRVLGRRRVTAGKAELDGT